MGVSIKAVTDAHQKLADRAVQAARGLEIVGGASKLTSTEMAQVNRTVERGIEAFRAMGKDVPPSLQKIADEAKNVEKAHGTLGSTLKTVALGFAALFTARAAVNFVGDVLREASALKDLSQQTHINVEELQLLSAAVSEFGVDADTLGKGLFTLSRKISGGDDSVSKALATMGLSLKDVQGLNGEALFLAIERGLATLQGSLRDETAATLFGSRLGMSMAGASEGIDAALEKARRLNTVLSKESIDAMDEYDESIKRAQRSLSAMAGNMIGPVAQGFNVLNDAAAKGASKWDIFVAVFKDFTNSGLRVGANTQALAKVLDDLNKKTEVARVVTAAFVGPLNQVGEAHARSIPKVKAHGEATKTFAADIAKTTPILVGASLSFKKYSEDVSQLAAVVPNLSAHMATMADRFADVRAHMDDLASSEIVPMFSKLPNVVAQAADAIREATAAAATLADTIRGPMADAFNRIPDILMRAFEGGGGLKGAFKAIGVMLADEILKPIIAQLSKVQKAAVSVGSGMAAALGGATGGGTGAAIAGIAGSLGGAALAASAWGTSMAAAGVAGTVALGAATLGIGAAAVGVVMLIKHLNSAEKAVNPIREQFVQMHGGIAALNTKAAEAGVTLTAMLNAKNPEQYKKAIDDLTAAFDRQASSIADAKSEIDRLTALTKVDFKDMQAVAEKYGIDLAALGPAFQSAKLSEAAKIIINDFDLLVRGGADADRVLAGMRKPINDLVNDSILFGTAIPENMKPWVDQLLLTGQLTDANGDKITDLSGLQFAPPIVTEFDKIVAKLQELIDKISGPLTTAITTIPAPSIPDVDFNITGHWNIPNRPEFEFAASGGLVTHRGIQQFAAGGRVLPFLRRGSDSVPAMLTPGEIILNEAQQGNVARAMSGGGTDLSGLRQDVAGLREDLARRDRTLPKMIVSAAHIMKAAG